ncbi:MAG: helix-turn-helix domain-containing protein [Kiritimatiellae bacterium]|nr:helix-turn-helix domain-containing protein [Kiritimatiellia bacterium]
MSFGEILRNARLEKGLSPSDVAAGTNMLVQIVEALEREDLKRIAAPIYGRGFVKLYAEFLNLDHEPLVRDFMEAYDCGHAPSLKLKPPQVCVDPAPVPVTRTVSESAVQGRSVEKNADFAAAAKPEPDEPARPVEAGAETEIEKPKIREVTTKAGDDIVRTAMVEDEPALVVSPEDAEAEADSEPDLFSIKPPRHKPAIEQVAVGGKKMDKPRVARGNQRLPVFKIGGHIDTAYIRKDSREHARALRDAMFQKAMLACGRVCDALVCACSSARLPRGKALAFVGAGVLALIVMISGLRVLFKMTGNSAADAPAAIIERVAPPPELYVD